STIDPPTGHHPRTHQLLPRVRAIRRQARAVPQVRDSDLHPPRLTRPTKAPPPHTHGMVGLPHAPTSNRHREPNRSRIFRPATPDHAPGAVETHPPPGTLSRRPRIFTSSPRTPPPTVLPYNDLCNTGTPPTPPNTFPKTSLTTGRGWCTRS